MLTKVRQDSHGVFVRINNHVMRPNKIINEIKIEDLNRTFNSSLKKGTTIRVTYLSIPPFSFATIEQIKDPKVIEIWISHGEHIVNNVQIKSDKIWVPERKI